MTCLVNPYRYGGPRDSNFSSTILLLGMNGANASTTFTDESFAAHGSATVGGDAQVTTAFKKFGTGSLRLDGAADNLRFADSADWTLAGDFTIEGFFSFDAANIEATQGLVTHYNTTSNQRGWAFAYRGGDATNNLSITGSSDGISASTLVSGNWTPTADTFYHIVCERSGTTFRLYVDGSMLAKATSSITLFNSTASLTIGDTANTNSEPLKGNIDELRISSIARYNSDSGYTVPTAAFPRS